MNETVLSAVKSARGEVKRNFSQTFDLIVNLKLMDTRKAENKINEIFMLPKGRGKDASVILFSDSAKDVGCEVYGASDIEKLAKDKRALRKMSNNVDFFFAEPKLMPIIGKMLGAVLAPRGKMPTVAAGDIKGLVERSKKSVRLRVKDAPVIQSLVGVDSMKDEDVTENIEALINFLEKRLPKGKNNIGKIIVKTTMGKTVKFSA